MNTKKTMKIMRDDRGYVFVEATIVYPIMFFVIIFLIYMGNMFLLRARIDSAVAHEAIVYANYFANPYVRYLEDNDYKIENTAKSNDLTNSLYRYLYKNGKYANSDEVATLEKRIGQIGFFNNVSPENIKVSAHGINNYVIYQTYEVEASYELKFPIKFIFMDDYWVLYMSAREEAPITDQSEFIRNIDMAVDYIERTEKGNKAIEQFSKLKNNFDKLLNKIGGKKE